MMVVVIRALLYNAEPISKIPRMSLNINGPVDDVRRDVPCGIYLLHGSIHTVTVDSLILCLV